MSAAAGAATPAFKRQLSEWSKQLQRGLPMLQQAFKVTAAVKVCDHLAARRCPGRQEWKQVAASLRSQHVPLLCQLLGQLGKYMAWFLCSSSPFCMAGAEASSNRATQSSGGPDAQAMQGGTGGADSLHNPVTVTVLGQEAPVHFAGVMLAMMCMGFTLKAATELGDVAADVMRPVMLAQQTGTISLLARAAELLLVSTAPGDPLQMQLSCLLLPCWGLAGLVVNPSILSSQRLSPATWLQPPQLYTKGSSALAALQHWYLLQPEALQPGLRKMTPFVTSLLRQLLVRAMRTPSHVWAVGGTGVATARQVQQVDAGWQRQAQRHAGTWGAAGPPSDPAHQLALSAAEVAQVLPFLWCSLATGTHALLNIQASTSMPPTGGSSSSSHFSFRHRYSYYTTLNVTQEDAEDMMYLAAATLLRLATADVSQQQQAAAASHQVQQQQPQEQLETATQGYLCWPYAAVMNSSYQTMCASSDTSRGANVTSSSSSASGSEPTHEASAADSRDSSNSNMGFLGDAVPEACACVWLLADAATLTWRQVQRVRCGYAPPAGQQGAQEQQLVQLLLLLRADFLCSPSGGCLLQALCGVASDGGLYTSVLGLPANGIPGSMAAAASGATRINGYDLVAQLVLPGLLLQPVPSGLQGPEGEVQACCSNNSSSTCCSSAAGQQMGSSNSSIANAGVPAALGCAASGHDSSSSSCGSNTASDDPCSSTNVSRGSARHAPPPNTLPSSAGGVLIDCGAGGQAFMARVPRGALRLPPGCIPPPAVFFLVEQLLQGSSLERSGVTWDMAVELLQVTVALVGNSGAPQQQEGESAGVQQGSGPQGAARQAAATELQWNAYCSLARSVLRAGMFNTFLPPTCVEELMPLVKRLVLTASEHAGAMGGSSSNSSSSSRWSLAASLAAATAAGAYRAHLNRQLSTSFAAEAGPHASSGSRCAEAACTTWSGGSSARSSACCPRGCKVCSFATEVCSALHCLERGGAPSTSPLPAGRQCCVWKPRSVA